MKNNFFKRWKEGILTLPVDKQLKGKLIGIVGGIFGLILALISLFYRRMWGFGIFVFFIIWLQFISYISTRQQYIATKETMKEIYTQQQEIQSPKVDKEIDNLGGK